MSSKRSWTPEQNQFIRDNYAMMDAYDIVDSGMVGNHNVQDVRAQAWRLGVRGIRHPRIDRRKRDNHAVGRWYDATPDEIYAACLEIRAGWAARGEVR